MNKQIVKGATFIARIIAQSYLLTQFARKIVMIHDNDCNDDFLTNGESAIQNYIKDLSNNESVIFDVGANVGHWSDMLLRSSYQGHLVVVDPVKSNLDKVERTLSKYIGRKFSFQQLALSDNQGTVTFFRNVNEDLCGHDSMYNMRLIGSKNEVRTTEVDCDTLDSLTARLGYSKILFLKIDVEGNELSTLKGASKLLSEEAIDFIQIEFGHAARAARTYLHDIINFIGQFSYDMFVIKPRGLSPLNFSPFTENRYSQINFLIAHKKNINKIKNIILEK